MGSNTKMPNGLVCEKWVQELKELAENPLSPALGQAILSVIAAIDYQDPTLIRSSLNDAVDALKDLVQDGIQSALKFARKVHEGWSQLWTSLDGRVFENDVSEPENLDRFGREIDRAFGKATKSLTDLRDNAEQIRRASDSEIEGFNDLERAIKDLQDLRKGALENWPWSQRSLPPVDRDMVARAKAGLASGQRLDSIEDLIDQH